MTPFAENLRRRAEELGISNAEAARRAGLSERRYAHYVSGQREPDLSTLVRIARVLGTSPNELLGFDGPLAGKSEEALLLERLSVAAARMPEEKLRVFVVQAEAIASI
jgi:transcriptional regulator with XRE-family HTH domain